MKDFATEDIRDIPNGVYSVKKGMAEGVYIMLKMPEEASGEVFWRFYPLGNVAQPITSPNDVLSIVEAGRDEHRFDIPPDENPFRHLQEPLKAVVHQSGQAYLDAISTVTSDSFTRRLRQFLSRDDLLQSHTDLFTFFNDWVEMPLPSDATRPRSNARSGSGYESACAHSDGTGPGGSSTNHAPRGHTKRGS